MTNNIQYDPKFESERWFGYFDLLGIRKLITSDNLISVFVAYQSAIDHLTSKAEGWDNIKIAWFSDTFIIYANDNSPTSFRSIWFVSSWFVYYLIYYRIPIRGAISCDKFYADKENTLYYGKALLEAYEYGEAQDWIGLLLCPSTIKWLKKYSLNPVFFTENQIPFKPNSKIQFETLPTCVIGNWVRSKGKNPIIEILIQMRERITDQGVIDKYDRTIEFLRNNQRTLQTVDGDDHAAI